jgi:hypothetical protein
MLYDLLISQYSVWEDNYFTAFVVGSCTLHCCAGISIYYLTKEIDKIKYEHEKMYFSFRGKYDKTKEDIRELQAIINDAQNVIYGR